MSEPLPVTPHPPESGVSWKRNLVFTWLSQFLSIAGFLFGLPFAPRYLAELGVVEKSQNAFYSSIFYAVAPLGFMISAPIWGKLADRYGRKLMMLRANAGAAFVLFGMGVAPNAMILIAMRMGQGLVTGTVPAAMTLMTSCAPENRQSFALGVLQSAIQAGAIAGLVLGGICFDLFGGATSFKLGAGLMVISFLCVFFGVEEEFEAPPTVPVCEEEALQGRRFRLRLPKLGAALGPILLFPVLALAKFMEKPALPEYIASFNTVLPGKDATLQGLVEATGGVAAVIAGIFLAGLADKYGIRRTGMIFGIGAAVSVLAFGFAWTLWVLVAARFFIFFFAGALEPVIQSWLSRNTPTARKGSVIGWAMSFRSLGWTMAPLLGGAIWVQGGVHALYIVEAGVFLTAVVLLAILFGRYPPQEAESSNAE